MADQDYKQMALELVSKSKEETKAETQGKWKVVYDTLRAGPGSDPIQRMQYNWAVEEVRQEKLSRFFLSLQRIIKASAPGNT